MLPTRLLTTDSSAAPRWLADLGLIILLGASSALLTWRLRVLRASALILACYRRLTWWRPLRSTSRAACGFRWCCPGGACLATHLCLVTWRVLFEQATNATSIDSTIVSPEIVHELLQAETLSLGGARREITIFFADVRGFTEFTESGQEQGGRDLVRREPD